MSPMKHMSTIGIGANQPIDVGWFAAQFYSETSESRPSGKKLFPYSLGQVEEDDNISLNTQPPVRSTKPSRYHNHPENQGQSKLTQPQHFQTHVLSSFIKDAVRSFRHTRQMIEEEYVLSAPTSASLDPGLYRNHPESQELGMLLRPHPQPHAFLPFSGDIRDLAKNISESVQLWPIILPLQEWEGYVTEVREGEFDARLTDLTAKSPVETEEATIPMDSLSPEDRNEVQQGALFRWTIGDRYSLGGSRKLVSEFTFRDFPVMTEEDNKRGQSWAKKIRKAFSSNE